MMMSQRPAVPAMLDLLEDAYRTLTAREDPTADDRARLVTVSDDLRWYSARLGAPRWEHAPRPGRWSVTDTLWRLAAQAVEAVRQDSPHPVRYFVDHGKEQVGQAAEILALFAHDDAATP